MCERPRNDQIGKSWAVIFLVLVFCAPFGRAQEYALGADVSFLGQAEKHGVAFRDNGTPKPGLEILKDHGYNWIRLRLFHTPTELPNNLDYTIALAKDAKKLGFKFLVDYHYADGWADPGKQPTPKAWQGKSHPELVEAVFEYTRDTTAAFRDAGVPPDMVQIGNEIIHGMLWPEESSRKTGTTSGNWSTRASTAWTLGAATIPGRES